MTKKRAARESADGDKPKDQVAAAEAAVEKARAALQQAQHAYERTCETAVEHAKKTRAITVGDMLDGTLEFVRRHPATGVLAAGLIGFLIGRSKPR